MTSGKPTDKLLLLFANRLEKGNMPQPITPQMVASPNYLVPLIHSVNHAADLATLLGKGRAEEQADAWESLASMQLHLKDRLQQRLVSMHADKVRLVADPAAGPDIVGIDLVEAVHGHTNAAHAPASLFVMPQTDAQVAP